MIIEIILIVLSLFFGKIISNLLVLIAPEELNTFIKYYSIEFISVAFIWFIFLFLFKQEYFLVSLFFIMLFSILISTKHTFKKYKKLLSQERSKIDYITSEEFVKFILKNKKLKIKNKHYFIAFFKLFK